MMEIIHKGNILPDESTERAPFPARETGSLRNRRPGCRTSKTGFV